MPIDNSQGFTLSQLYDMAGGSGLNVTEQGNDPNYDFDRSIGMPTLQGYLGRSFAPIIAQDSEGNVNYGETDKDALNAALMDRYGTSDVRVGQDWTSRDGMFNTGVYRGDGNGRYSLTGDNRWNVNDTKGDLMAIVSTLAGPLMGGMGSEAYQAGQAYATGAGSTAGALGGGMSSDLYSLGSGNMSGGQGLAYSPTASSGGNGLTYGVNSGGSGFYGTQGATSAGGSLGSLYSPSNGANYNLRSPVPSGGDGLQYGGASGGEGLTARTPTTTGYGLDSGLPAGLGGGGSALSEPVKATPAEFNPAQDSQAANSYDYVGNGLGDMAGGNLDYAVSNYTTPAMDAGATPWYQTEAAKFARQQLAKRAGEKTNNPFLRTALGVAGGDGGTFGTIVNGATGIYQAQKYAKDLKNNRNQLSGLFSSNSPYAQEMRQRLERQDAASGRRSQYGNREVQLAAALAQNQSRLLPQINEMDHARRVIPVQQAAALGQMYQKMGGLEGMGKLYDQGTNAASSFMDWLGS
jgi:hypothetical protein